VAVADSTRLEPNGRTNYEIYRRTSAGWEFRTVRLEMEEAIKEAKRSLELPGTEAVRVVRDHYDPATNTVRPNTVFRAVAEAPKPVKQGFWAKLHAAAPGSKAARRSHLVGRLAASLIGVALGTAVTLLRS
jgi:hypothetical protein